MRKRAFGALAFVAFVVGVIALQTFRQSPMAVQTQDFASTKVPLAKASCRSKILQDPLTVESLQSLIGDSNIQSVQDLVCCLPESYRQNYVVMHSSFAFQAGVPDNPRVILMGPLLQDSGPRVILTVTGSRIAVNGANHVEIFSRDQDQNKNDLYDIDFTRSPVQTEKNPSTCMGCHSPNPADLASVGVKPIFQDFPWPSTVGFTQHLEDSRPKTYFQTIENHALAALKTDPVYSCLQPKSIEQHATMPEIFDSIVLRMNEDRVARLIEQTKDYKKIRPLLAGFAEGCFTGIGLPPAKGALDFFEQEFPKWVPAKVADTVFSDDHFISPQLRSADHIRQELVSAMQFSENSELAIRAKRGLQKNIGGVQALYQPSPLFSALYKDDFSEYHQIGNAEVSEDFPTAPPTSLKAYSKSTQLLARYALDSISEPHFGTGVNPFLRFLFEARGISTVTWSKEMAGSYGATLNIPLARLMENESSDPFWENVTSDLCGYLRQESFKNFSGN